MREKFLLEKLGGVLWRVVPLVVGIGILCVWLAPDDFKKLKQLGFVLIYCAGLPFLLGCLILYLEKKGWLK